MSATDPVLDALESRFRGREHEPFVWECGEPAALLIHGFLGSPDEVRALASSLFDHGWTTHVPLLPGFGPDIGTLYRRRHEEWATTAEAAWRAVRREHSPAIVVGFSMGAAVAIQAAGALGADGVILISPFWELPIGSGLLHFLGPALNAVLRRIRPFRFLNLKNRDLRQGIHELLPSLDLGAPAVRTEIRKTAVPIRVLLELQRCGDAGHRAAANVVAPALVIQGSTDEIVSPHATRRLLARLAGPVTYREVAGSHELLRTTSPAWDAVRQDAVDFAAAIKA